VASVGNWRIHPDQPREIGIGHAAKTSLSNGAVDLSRLPDGRRVSLRTCEQRKQARLKAERKAQKRASRHRNRPTIGQED
jgi:hypothetical protein